MVLILLALLMGAAVQVLRWHVATGRGYQTRQVLDQAVEALRGFAAFSGGRLPCPDSEVPLDGREDINATTGECSAQDGEGWFPYATLGGPGREDAWNARLRYRVLPALASLQSTRFPDPVLLVCERPRAGQPCGQPVAEQLVAIVVSHGANGHWGLGYEQAGQPRGHEWMNADRDDHFVMHEPRSAAGEGGPFDDQLAWLPNSLYQATVLLQ